MVSFHRTTMATSPRGTPIEPTKTFADVVGRFKITETLNLKELGVHQGELALFFTDEDIENLATPFQFALIGKFSRGKPSLPGIRATFDSIGFRSIFNIGLLDKKKKKEKHILV